MPGDLARRIEQTDPRLLVPSGSVAPDQLRLVSSWVLPASGPVLIASLLQDAESGWHFLPLVDDSFGLRRARAGDGWAAAVVGAMLDANAGAGSDGFLVRLAPDSSAIDLPGVLSERTDDSTPEFEVTLLGDSVRVRLNLLPDESDGPSFDVVSHLASAGFTSLTPSFGEIVWAAEGQWVAPLVGVASPINAMPLDEAFGRIAARHLRGGDDAEPTLELTRSLAQLLAGLHASLATPSSESASPLTFSTADDAAHMARAARDAVAEAVVLTDDRTQQNVRARTHAMRDAFDALANSSGTPLLPAAPFVTLRQAYHEQSAAGSLVLDPLQVTAAGKPRVPVADLASLLRALNHVAHGAMRRLVGGGESVPVERVSSWGRAVREVLLEEYRAALDASGHADLFDENLLLGLELEAECRALSYAARHLSTWSAVPDAGLLELLPPD